MSQPGTGGGPDVAERAKAIIKFWFSDESREHWFAKDDLFDRKVTETFLGDYERVASGDRNGWPSTPQGSLALTILLDQFPRNIFRDDARAFTTDDAARHVAGAAIVQGFDDQLTTEMRRFLYMPFMHSEDVVDQERCISLFTRRGDDDGSVDYALRHKHIIDRFGRFPHRNALLGRQTTADEAVFLREPGSSF